METQKIVNLLGDANNESSKFATRKWYVINDQNNTDYGEGNEDSTTVKFETKVIKSNLCDYSDAYILVTGNITGASDDANNRVAFKNCPPFTKSMTHINDEHICLFYYYCYYYYYYYYDYYYYDYYYYYYYYYYHYYYYYYYYFDPCK